MIDYHDYLGDKVRIIDKDGQTTEGIAISYSVGLDDDLDYDSIGIQQVGKGFIIDIPIPDIVKIEVLGD